MIYEEFLVLVSGDSCISHKYSQLYGGDTAASTISDLSADSNERTERTPGKNRNCNDGRDRNPAQCLVHKLVFGETWASDNVNIGRDDRARNRWNY